MIYQWKPGARIGLDAQRAGEHLERLRGERGGTLTAEDVVEDARDESSPLHSAFEWNETAAARAYRLEQARHLMRCVVVTYRDAEKPPQEIRAFVCVRPPSEPRKSYTHVHAAMADPVLREQVLRTALAEAEAWRRRWAQYEELGRVFDAIDKARRSLTKERAKAG